MTGLMTFCRQCGAGKGKPCVNPVNGKTRDKVHASRRRIAVHDALENAFCVTKVTDNDPYRFIHIFPPTPVMAMTDCGFVALSTLSDEADKRQTTVLTS